MTKECHKSTNNHRLRLLDIYLEFTHPLKIIRSSILKKSRVEKNKEDADIANQTITMIREASLTKSTSQELKEWNDWLRINNMYEDHAV